MPSEDRLSEVLTEFARTLVTADTWTIEPNEPTVQERALLDEAEDALRDLRQLGPYWRDAR